MVTAIALCLVVGLMAFIAYLATRPRKDAGTLKQVTKLNPSWTPITLVIDEEGLVSTLPRIRFGLQRAIAFWNEGLGFEVFVKMGDIGRGAVVPVLAVDQPGEAIASADLTIGKDGSIKDALVKIDEGKLYALDDRRMIRALCHELGHVLGLDHDDSPLSIMYGRTSICDYAITNKDKQLLSVYRRTDEANVG